jgi:hypothetical protein
MRNRLFLIIWLIFLTVSSAVISAQTPSSGAKPSVATGDVTSISEGKIVLQTKDGSLDVLLAATTEYKRVPAENPVLKAAVPAALADIATGDKLLVTGFFSDDKKTLPARSVYIMSKSDIAEKNKKESEQWTVRGVSGRVASIDQQTGQIKIEIRGLANTSTVVLTPKGDAKFRRYAPNSVKYSESKESSSAEIQAGDMLRARGDKSADGASFAADEIVSGAFQTIAGTVKSVDVAKNEVVITDAQSKKDITIELGSASVLKKFPEEFAQRMVQMQAMQAAGGTPPGAGGGRPAGTTPPANGQAGPGQAGGGPGRGGFSGRGGSIDEMLDRFPNITAADLKAGDVIAISSSKSNTPDRLTAIKLLAGVEPFLRAAQAQAAAGGQRSQSLNIPGLDGLTGP